MCYINKRDFSVKEMRTSVDITWILPRTGMEYARSIILFCLNASAGPVRVLGSCSFLTKNTSLSLAGSQKRIDLAQLDCFSIQPLLYCLKHKKLAYLIYLSVYQFDVIYSLQLYYDVD